MSGTVEWNHEWEIVTNFQSMQETETDKCNFYVYMSNETL